MENRARRTSIHGFNSWAHQGSNLGPTDYESLADNQSQFPRQPATVRPVDRCSERAKVLSNGVSEQIKEPSNILAIPYTTPHSAFNSIEEIYGSVMNYFI